MDPSKQVLAVRTPLTPTEAIDAIWHAHVDVIGGPCPISLLTILTAQSALETGRWQSMKNFNFGYMRGGGTAGEWITVVGANEIENGKLVTGPAVEGGFGAWRDRYDGARAFVRFLGTPSHPPAPNRYQAAWDAATAGDIDGYVHGLKLGAYMTANEATYDRGVHAQVAWLKSGPIPKFLEYLSAEPVTLGA